MDQFYNSAEMPHLPKRHLLVEAIVLESWKFQDLLGTSDGLQRAGERGEQAFDQRYAVLRRRAVARVGSERSSQAAAKDNRRRIITAQEKVPLTETRRRRCTDHDHAATSGEWYGALLKAVAACGAIGISVAALTGYIAMGPYAELANNPYKAAILSSIVVLAAWALKAMADTMQEEALTRFAHILCGVGWIGFTIWTVAAAVTFRPGAPASLGNAASQGPWVEEFLSTLLLGAHVISDAVLAGAISATVRLTQLKGRAREEVPTAAFLRYAAMAAKARSDDIVVEERLGTDEGLLEALAAGRAASRDSAMAVFTALEAGLEARRSTARANYLLELLPDANRVSVRVP